MTTRAITDTISIGGQPDENDIQALQDQGFRTIVNLRTPGEEGYRESEEREVEGKGLTYAAIPTSPELLDDLAMQRFTGAVATTDATPVYVHCAGGGRAGILALLHLAVTNGWTLEEALAAGHELGITFKEDSPYRAFFEDYIKRHSAGERL